MNLFILTKSIHKGETLNDSNSKKRPSTVAPPSNYHKTSESDAHKPEGSSTKASEKDEESEKPEKSDKKDRPSMNVISASASEKSRRKQVEIELKKWEKEQVFF